MTDTIAQLTSASWFVPFAANVRYALATDNRLVAENLAEFLRAKGVRYHAMMRLVVTVCGAETETESEQIIARWDELLQRR